MRTNTVRKDEARTHEGAQSRTLSAVDELRRTVMSCLLWEDTFYESGASVGDRIKALLKKVSFEDAASIAIDAREKMKLRHVPLLITRELLRNHHGRKVGDLVFRVIQRADEIAELVAMYWKDAPHKMLPRQLKVGLSRAFKKFDEFQLAKNDRPGAVRLRDAMFMARPYAKGEDQVALFKRIADDELQTPDTWEVALSAGADKKETFTRLIQDKRLGGLALLRNLRKMLEVGVDDDVIKQALQTMKTERILPFRFITAARYAPRFEQQLEGAMFKSLAEVEKLPGKTALLVDHSMSMESKVSEKSEISRFDAAAALAMILREKAEDCRVFTFSDRCIEIPPRRGFAMLDAIRAVRNPTSTFLGAAVRAVYSVYPDCSRIIVVTDEQSADRPGHPRGAGYILNVGTFKNGIGYGPWVSIDGWSEACFDFIHEYERASDK